jgi:DNA-binding NtrC family response regulator
LKNQKILIVDDEESIRLSLEHQLTEEGFNVDTAESGEEAIEKIDKDSSWDLVITDLRMYGVSGLDVLKKVREVNVNTLVLIITGFGGDSPMFKEAMELKPCGHAFKPFPKDEILKKINICLNRVK